MYALAASSHRNAFALLIASALLAAIVAQRDPRAPGLALAVLLWGGVACAIMVAVCRRSRSATGSPVLRAFQASRGTIADEIQRVRQNAAVRDNPPLELVFVDALTVLDEEIAPALHQLAASEADFRHHLALYDAGRLPRPHLEALERLEANASRQHDASQVAMQRIAGAEASLFALVHRVRDPGVVEQARQWLDELRAIQDYLGDVLAGAGESQPESPTARETEPPMPMRPSKKVPELSTLDESVTPTEQEFVRLVEQAMRNLNKPGALARCQLTSRLPRTLAATRARWSESLAVEPTALEQAQALVEVMNAAIDQLKPTQTDDHAATALQYEVLHLEYRLGMQIKHIERRLSIGEATCYRHRKDAIRAIADHLRSREEALALAPVGMTSSPHPPA